MPRVFRIGVLFVVFILLFVSLLSFVGGSSQFESRLLASIAGVGMSIGVAPNPENTMAEALHEWDDELAARQAAVIARERAAALDRARTERQALYVLAAEGVLCFFIAFDFVAGRRKASIISRREESVSKFFS